jgi:hypothetical protein
VFLADDEVEGDQSAGASELVLASLHAPLRRPVLAHTVGTGAELAAANAGEAQVVFPRATSLRRVAVFARPERV